MESLNLDRSLQVLKDVLAYVEVRSKCENRSKEIEIQLQKLGACISAKITNQVTHVVFKDGTKRTWDRAKKLGIPVVSVLWVDCCKRNLQRAREETFLASTPHNISEASIVDIFRKKRSTNFRCMQPKNLNEEFLDSSLRCDRRRMRSSKPSDQHNSSLSDVYLTPVSELKQNIPRIKTPPSMKEKLLQYNRHQDNTPVSHRSSQKLNLHDSSDVENNSPTEENKILNCEGFKSLCLDASAQKQQQHTIVPSSPLSINDQTSNVSAGASSVNYLTNQSDINTQQFPEALSDVHLSNEKSNDGTVGLDSPRSWINKSPLFSLSDTLSAGESSPDIPEAGVDDVSSTVFKNCNIFSKSPVDKLSNNHPNTSWTCHKNSPIDSKRKFSTKDSKLDVSEGGDNDSPNLIGLSNNVDSARRDDNVPAAVYRAPDRNISPNSGSHNSQTDLVSGNDVVTMEISQECKAWDMPQQKESEKVSECSETVSSSPSQALSQDFGMVPTIKRRRVSVSFDISSKSRNLRPIKKYLVMSSMSVQDQEMVISVTKALGQCVISDCVNKSTTHVICGVPRRTLNVLLALSQGCWLLSKEWVLESMQSGNWLQESKFELVSDYPIAKIYREQKLSKNMFHDCGNIYVSAVKAPPKKDIVRLLQQCGGKVMNTVCHASIYVGEDYHPSLISVTPLWIFDSITSGRLMPFDDYMLGYPKPPSPEY